MSFGPGPDYPLSEASRVLIDSKIADAKAAIRRHLAQHRSVPLRDLIEATSEYGDSYTSRAFNDLLAADEIYLTPDRYVVVEAGL